eukprot:GSA120T00017384001.1
MHGASWLDEKSHHDTVLELFAILGYLFPQGVVAEVGAVGRTSVKRWDLDLLQKVALAATTHAATEAGKSCELLLARLMLTLSRMNFVYDPLFAALCDRVGPLMGGVSCGPTLYDLAMMLANRSYFTERSEDLGLVLLADVIRAALPLLEQYNRETTVGGQMLLFKPILWACSSFNHFDEPFLTVVTQSLLGGSTNVASAAPPQELHGGFCADRAARPVVVEDCKTAAHDTSGKSSLVNLLTAGELADLIRSFGQLNWRTAVVAGRKSTTSVDEVSDSKGAVPAASVPGQTAEPEQAQLADEQ